MTEYIEIPESFTERMQLCKSRYCVERSERFVCFVREFWNGKEWERSHFGDGITVPSCVADAVANALSPRSDYPVSPCAMCGGPRDWALNGHLQGICYKCDSKRTDDARSLLPTEKQIKAWLEGVSRTGTGRMATSALAVLDCIDWTPEPRPETASPDVAMNTKERGSK